MSKARRKTKSAGWPRESELPRAYRRACRLALRARYEEARRAYTRLEAADGTDARVRSLTRNDLSVLDVLSGEVEGAFLDLQESSSGGASCEAARLNLALLRAELGTDRASGGPMPRIDRPSGPLPPRRPTRIAILSFLFNWPSTGGGIVHTVELGRFLSRAGYEVRHVYAEYPAWDIGNVLASGPVPGDGLAFTDGDWDVRTIQERYRRAVDAFRPDFVLITDAWSMKPLLAEAVSGYPYYLRFQALECLCPLNNLRLLARGPGDVEQCARHQLATAEACRRCLDERGRYSGQLHQLERTLAGVATPEYQSTLRRALEEAEAVLVLNPLTQAMLGPYARRVEVVPWGMDSARFPWPHPPVESSASAADGVVTLFMAAVAGEFIKGFHVLHAACARLRRSRADFELVVTFDPPGRIDEFTRSVGWQSQDDLPRWYRAADICVVPTIAQEGLSRTSVEAMASGLPVVASRIGGLPYTVADGVTGLLFDPGDPDDLARKLVTVLDDAPLRRRMGSAGRKRFEEDFTWDVVIERYYRPLFTTTDVSGASRQRGAMGAS